MTKSEGSHDGSGRAVRRATMAPSTMRARGLGATDVTVVDISATGVRIATSTDLAVGEEVSIGLTGVGARRAYVAWRREGEYGCAFEVPLDLAETDRAFSSASVVRLGSLDVSGRSGPSAALADLHAQHRPWTLPLDAMLFGIAYLMLFAWAGWMLIRML